MAARWAPSERAASPCSPASCPQSTQAAPGLADLEAFLTAASELLGVVVL